MRAALCSLAALAIAGSMLVGAETASSTVSRPLAGLVIGIDPGHNGGNFNAPAAIARPVWNGREWESCDTTGTATDAGYTEAAFNWSVANYLKNRLIQLGAKVVLTRNSNHGVGPCIDRRAKILDAHHVAVAIDIHADGGPPGGRGFTVLTPVRDGINNAVVNPSIRFGRDVRAAMLSMTGIPVSTYDGTNGMQPRDNLAGLNLTTVPKVLVECANMRNAKDAALLTSAAERRKIAGALLAAMLVFLHR